MDGSASTSAQPTQSVPVRGALDWPVMSTGRSLSRAHANSVASRVGGERLLNRNELVLLAEPAVPLLHAVPATASLSQCQPTSSCFASETSSLAPCLFQNLNSALDSIRFTPALFQYESSASEASTRPKGPHEDSVEGLEMQLERDRLDIFTELACGGLIPTYLPDRSAGFKSQAPEDDEHLNASTGPRAEIHHLSSLRHPSKARCQKFPMRHRMEA
eukprot:scaffold280046_cov35-Tisochrysis_lutea.AAC.3